MRITKVKVKNNDIKIVRTIDKGYLSEGEYNKDTEEKLIAFLNNKKIKNFHASLVNKTIRKDFSDTDCPTEVMLKMDSSNDITYKIANERLRVIRSIIEETLESLNLGYSPKNTSSKKLDELIKFRELNKEDLKVFLNHKFKVEVLKYGDKPHEIGFNFADELNNGLKSYNTIESIANALVHYKQWAQWYTDRKIKLIAKSIYRNNTSYPPSSSQNVSSRKLALEQLANNVVSNEFDSICDKLASEFKLKEICTEWETEWENVTKIPEDDVNKLKQSCQNCAQQSKAGLPDCDQQSKAGIPVDFFEFKRNLKKKLHEHQKNIILKSNKKQNHILVQYSLELNKYLELYFPLKMSNKKKSISESYLKYYLYIDTIKKALQNKLKNATIQYLIQQGKLIQYNIQDSADSNKLQEIKVKEAFALHFINACAFAANNLRNVIDVNQVNDVLTKKELKVSLQECLNDDKKKDTAICKLMPFFALKFLDKDHAITSNEDNILKHLTEPSDFLSFVAAIRSSISSIRNKVIHFNEKAYTEILNTQSFEGLPEQNGTILNCSSDSCSYNSSFLATLMQEEVKKLPQLFAEKIKSASLLEWYEIDDILNNISEFELFSKPLAFIPSFKKVFAYGKKQQFPENSNGIYSLNIYFKELKQGQQSANYYEARRNALKLVYENIFVNDFLSEKNKECFAEIVKLVIDANKNSAKRKDKFAFFEIPYYYDDENKNWRSNSFEDSPKGYLQALQSALINDENKKRKAGTLKEDETGYFQQFLFYLFMKGFDLFISGNNQYEFIKNPKEKCTGTVAEKTNALNQRLFEYRNKIIEMQNPIKHSIVPTKSEQIAFWTFCKMLDNEHLNELSNQISKLRQAIKKEVVKNNLTEENLQTCQEIIALCILSTDTCYAAPDKTDIEPYTEDAARNNEIYIQADSETPVLFAGVKIAKKYATEAIIKEAIKNYKVSGKNITEWTTAKETIAEITAKKQELHKEWASASNKNKWIYEKNGEFTKNAREYSCLCKQIDDYTWLNNKIHMVHIKKLHDLLIEILGRFAGFVSLFDRDFIFFDRSTSSHRVHDDYRILECLNFKYLVDNKNDDEIKKVLCVSKGHIFKSFEDFNNASLFSNGAENIFLQQIQEKRNFYNKHFFAPNTKPIDDRNFIAHFNYLTKSAPCSVLQLISKVRSLVSYDRKLKNAVVKSFIDILDRHGLIIKFKPLHETEHKLEIKCIKPKPLYHFKNKNGKSAFTTQLRSSEYAEMVKKLLEFPNKLKKQI